MAKKRDFPLIMDTLTGEIKDSVWERILLQGNIELIPNFDMINEPLSLVRVNYATSGGGIFVFENSAGKHFIMHNSEFNKLISRNDVTITDNFTFKKQGTEYSLRLLDSKEKPINTQKILDELGKGRKFNDF